MRADRAACLVDGEAYFQAVASAVTQARHQVGILCWDIHSRVPLFRGEAPPPELAGLPEELGPFLAEMLARRPELRVRILEWDFGPLHVLERESSLFRKLGAELHPRLELVMDDRHPVGGSHHQKLVVIDDALAFVGGFDLAGSRRDGRAHAPDDPLRTNPDGRTYGPFHDVQLVVDGEPVRALGELFRARWERATGERLAPPPPVETAPWPGGVEDAIEDVPLLIARTEPAWEGRPEVREIERLHLDAIAAARKTIFMEFQYATADSIGRALAARLAEPDGPELVLFVPRTCSGWIEEATMGQVRGRFLAGLRRAAGPGRLHVYYPVSRTEGGGEGCDTTINVHSKVVVIDDALLRVGSANLSNRSMGLDDECDLLVESEGREEVRAWIARFRDGLVAEHLGLEPEQVAREAARRGSLGAAIEQLRTHGGRRTLVPLEEAHERWPEAVDAALPVFDPNGEVAPEELLGEVQAEKGHGGGRRRILVPALLAVGVLGLGLLWKVGPLREWIDPERLGPHLAPWRDEPWGLPLAIALFALASLLLVPLPLLAILAMVVFGPVRGSLCALAGSLSSACLAHAFGRLISPGTLQRVARSRLERLAEALRKRGLLAIITVRLVPVAPYTVVNLVAGATGIRLRDLVVGTLLVLTPGTIALAVGSDRVLAAIESPGALSLLLALAVVLVLSLGMWWIRSKLVGRVHPAPS